jgi:hypothetical protein
VHDIFRCDCACMHLLPRLWLTVRAQGGTGEDWRAFRARLIQTGISAQQNQSEAAVNGSRPDNLIGTQARKMCPRSRTLVHMKRVCTRIGTQK